MIRELAQHGGSVGHQPVKAHCPEQRVRYDVAKEKRQADLVVAKVIGRDRDDSGRQSPARSSPGTGGGEGLAQRVSLGFGSQRPAGALTAKRFPSVFECSCSQVCRPGLLQRPQPIGLQPICRSWDSNCLSSAVILSIMRLSLVEAKKRRVYSIFLGSTFRPVSLFTSIPSRRATG